MYLRTSQQKRKDGSVLTHLQIAESVWDPLAKRSRTKIVYNVGRAEEPAVVERMRRLARSILRRCAPEELETSSSPWKLVDAWPYGDVYVLEQLWERLGIRAGIERAAAGRRFDFSLERALFAMVANRACAPASKLYCFEQWLREDVRVHGADELELHHLYRAMDFLDEERETIEKEVFFSVSDLLNLDVELIFYDTTSLHFEVEQPADGATEDVPSGELRRRGHSKNGRGDAPQIVVGMAVTRDGFPVRHWTFPGNTVDVTTVSQVRADLRGWRLTRCVFVGDAGMVSEENLRQLSRGGGKYIVGVPVRREREVAEEVLTRAGRFRQVAENLRVKEVLIGDGERRRRYVVCHNPQEEARQCAHREAIVARLEAELAALEASGKSDHPKRACELMASRRYGKYLRQLKSGALRLNRSRLKSEARLDGKWVIRTNDDTLTAEDLALGYKQLMRAEEAWRSMKSGLGMRPVYHYSERRIRAHIALTVLALLLERAAEHACRDTWRNIRDDLKQVKLAQLSSPDGTVWQVTEPTEEASNRLKSLQIVNPGPVLKIT